MRRVGREKKRGGRGTGCSSQEAKAIKGAGNKMAGLYREESKAQPQLRLFPPFKYLSNEKTKPLFPRLKFGSG